MVGAVAGRAHVFRAARTVQSRARMADTLDASGLLRAINLCLVCMKRCKIGEVVVCDEECLCSTTEVAVARRIHATPCHAPVRKYFTRFSPYVAAHTACNSSWFVRGG